MNKILTYLTTTLILFFNTGLKAQVHVAPYECYGYATPGDMNAAADGTLTNPFATWKAAYDYAIANTINTINFTPGYYNTNMTGFRTDWGDASGGFDLIAGMTVNGNGAVVDNTGAGSSEICFANIAGNGASISGFTFIEFSGVGAGGAIGVNGAFTAWTISNCNFDACDRRGGDAVTVSAGATGIITDCKFYNHSFATSSALGVEGGSNIDVNSSSFTCNYRDNTGGAGGAVEITGASTVNFNTCIFDGNQAGGSAPGGAIYIESNSIVSLNNSELTCNLANTGVEQDGGAVFVNDGSSLTVTNSNFTGNQASRYGGAIAAASTGNTSKPTIVISGTTFDGNLVSTRGGAIRLADAIANIDNNYFINNQASSSGGALSVETGGEPVYPTNTAIAETDVENNTFLSNVSGTCSPDIYTEIEIWGQNDLEFHSDGPAFSEYKGDNFDRGATGNVVGNVDHPWVETESSATDISISGSGTDLQVRMVSNSGIVSIHKPITEFNTTLSSNDSIMWTFTFDCPSALDGFSSGEGVAYVLAANGSDFGTADGYAVVVNSSDRLQLVHFASGLVSNANLTEIATGGTINTGSASVKVVYKASGNTWDMYYNLNTSGDAQLYVDPRNYNNEQSCYDLSSTKVSGTNSTYTGVALGFTGAVWKATSTSFSRQARFDNIYHRGVDERDNEGWSGSFAPIACKACESSPNIGNCGSIAGIVYVDNYGDGTTANNDGSSLSNLDGASGGIDSNLSAESVSTTVYLYSCTLCTDTGNLTNPDNVLVETQASIDGAYLFDDLVNGNYFVVFDDPTGFIASTQNTTLNGATGEWDSDGGTSHVMTISNTAPPTTTGFLEEEDNNPGASNYINIDAGFYEPIVVAGTIYVDTDNDNIGDQTYKEASMTITVETTAPDGSIVNFIGMSSLVDGTYSINIPAGYSINSVTFDSDGFTANMPPSGNTLEPGLVEITSLNVCSVCDNSLRSGFTEGGLLLNNFSLPLAALPIELGSFTVEEDNCQAVLKWMTLSEEENDYFEVQRSIDGRNFETIAKIQGAGNSLEEIDYEYIDTNPLTNNYYRLAWVDFAGNIEYGKIVFIELAHCNESFTVLSAYPNPVTHQDNLQIELYNDKEGTYNYQIFNSVGKSVSTGNINLNSGTQTFGIKLEHLQSGAYSIIIKDDNNNAQILKFIRL